MADITKLSRLKNGVQRQVDLAANTLVVSTIKIGGATNTELTKADLDVLIGGADAAALHNHNSQYYTQGQIGSTVNGSAGASLVGVDAGITYTNFATPSDVQDAIQKIDVALTTAGLVEFADNEFKVYDDLDNTKKMAFQLSGLSTSTERVLTLQDKNIIVAGIADETFTGTTTVDKLQVDGQAYSPIQSQTASTDSAIDWDESNVQRITLDQNTTLTFANGADGGQYLLVVDQDGVGGHSLTFPSTVDFIGAAPTIQQGANDRTIVSFFYDPSKTAKEYQGLSSNDIISMANGGTGANLSPVNGAIVYSDADSMELLNPGTSGQVLMTQGAAAPTWLTLAGGDGVAYSSGTFSVDLAADPGLEFDSNQLRVKIDAAGAVLRGASGLSVAVDDSTIEIATNALQVKADGIKSTHVAFDNNTGLRIRNFTDSAYIEAIKVDASDDIVFGSLPKDASVPVVDAHLVNKKYVDEQIQAAAAGLDPKESVRISTVADISGTYNSSGGTGTSGEFTAVDLTSSAIFDGLVDANAGAITLAIGDRILVKNQSDAKENGIYVVTTAGAAGVIERAADQDGTPANEVSGGNHTFIEGGSTLSNSGYVLIGDGILTLNTDNISWTPFSAPAALSGGDGIDLTGGTISVDLSAASGLEISTGKLQVDLLASGGLKLVGNEIAVEPADFAGNGLKDDGSDSLALDIINLAGSSFSSASSLAYQNAAGEVFKVSWNDIIGQLAGDGIVQNGNALDVNAGDGMEVTSDAVALDINGIAGSTTTLQNTDLFAIHDDSAADNATISVGDALGDGIALSAGKIAAQLGNGIEFDTLKNMKLGFDALAAETTMADSDVFAFSDISAAGDTDHKKITLQNLLTQLSGDGLAISGTTALKVVAGEGTKIANDQVELDINGLTAETTIENTDEVVFYDVSASAHKKITRENLLGDLSQVSETMVAGEAFEANTVHAVRIAVSGETAGSVYKSDNDAATNDNFYVIGLAINDTASAITATSSIKVVKLGAIDLEASDLTFVAGDAGKPVYLNANGDLTLTAPTAADSAVVKVGTLRDVASNGKLEVQIQVMGIN